MYFCIVLFFSTDELCSPPHCSPLGSGPGLPCLPWWPISCDRPFEAFHLFQNPSPLWQSFLTNLCWVPISLQTHLPFPACCYFTLCASITLFINPHHAGFIHQLCSIFPFFCLHFVHLPLSLHGQR